MNIKNITAWFADMRRRARGSMDPVRDWLVLVALSLFALIGIVVWNAWAFETVAGGGTLGGAQAVSTNAFTPSSLNSIQSIFEARAEEQQKYVTGVYRFADPSQ